MVRNYVRKTAPTKVAYMKNRPAEVTEAVELVKKKELSVREMARRLKISVGTALKYIHARPKRIKRPGHPTIFSETEEKMFKARMVQLYEYGFHFTRKDLRVIVGCYLKESPRTGHKFKKKIPGEDWVKGFRARHEDISQWFPCKTPLAKDPIDDDNVERYANNLAAAVAGVPPENIVNYDEINFLFDADRRTICRRRSKHSKGRPTETNMSVMFCATADGEQIPPYIVYKSEQFENAWTVDGPTGARYNRTSNGWFDPRTFEHWFLHHLLPILKKRDGRKVIVGDNFASHITFKILAVCESEDIRFVCLPPNSTHVTQPLDIVYFRPLENSWQRNLVDFDRSAEGKRFDSFPKTKAAGLVKVCLDNLEPTIKRNTINGFRKTGIYPFDRDTIMRNVIRERECHDDGNEFL